MGHITILKLLIPLEININATDKDGNVALNITTNIKVFKLLIKSGFDVNKVNKDSYIPLHFVCILNNFDLSKILIDHSADINYVDKDNLSILDFLLKFKPENKEIIDYLISKGAKRSEEL